MHLLTKVLLITTTFALCNAAMIVLSQNHDLKKAWLNYKKFLTTGIKENKLINQNILNSITRSGLILISNLFICLSPILMLNWAYLLIGIDIKVIYASISISSIVLFAFTTRK